MYRENACQSSNDYSVEEYNIKNSEELKQMEIAEAHMIMDFKMFNKWDAAAFENVLMDKLPDDYSLTEMDADYVRFMSTKSKKLKSKLAAEFLNKYEK